MHQATKEEKDDTSKPSSPPEGEEKRKRRSGDQPGWIKMSRSKLEILEDQIVDLQAEVKKRDQIIADKDLGYKTLLELAQIDNLTKLINRDGFWKAFQREHNQNRAHNLLDAMGRALLLFDVDFFKQVNDSEGHSVGDFVLAAVADIIKRKVQRSDDIVCRWGGEEFACLLQEHAKPDTEVAGTGRRQGERLMDVYNFAEEIRQTIAKAPILLPGTIVRDGRQKSISVTVSIGGLVWVGSPREYSAARRDLEEKFGVADRYLYQAKENGRNRVIIKPWHETSAEEGA